MPGWSSHPGHELQLPGFGCLFWRPKLDQDEPPAGLINHTNNILILNQSPSRWRWCTVAASADKLQQISIIEFCVWVPPKKIQTTPSTSLKMHGGETSRTDTAPQCAVIIFVITYLLLRSMHYPPETASIMLMARMVAVVKQVRLFKASLRWFAVKCIPLCVPTLPNINQYPRQDTKTHCWLSCRCLKSNFMVFNLAWNELANVKRLVRNRCQTPCHAVTICGTVLICSTYCQTYTILRRKTCVITDASAWGVCWSRVFSAGMMAEKVLVCFSMRALSTKHGGCAIYPSLTQTKHSEWLTGLVSASWRQISLS